jgi:nucleoside-diphosphate-sugar epimerase
MNLLIIGGGVFLGQALLQAALERGDAVTVFNRGQSRNWWPPGVKWIIGDRKEDLHLLMGRRWDAVIDTCGYRPQDVEATCATLFDSVDRYVFISSVSAYASFAHSPIREEDPLASAAGVDQETINPGNYGPLKAECERTMFRIFGSRGIAVRPGLIVGPTDPTGRFSYWPWRVSGGGHMLAPGSPHTSVQFIDVRDLAAWTLRLIQLGATGAFNGTGPNEVVTFGELLDTCRWITGEEVGIEWVDERFLEQEGVHPWTELPLWIPTHDAQTRGFNTVDTARAQATGLKTRPIAVTINDILEAGIPPLDDRRRLGKLTRERERDLLAVWQLRKKGLMVA